MVPLSTLTPGWGRHHGFLELGVAPRDLSTGQVVDRLHLLTVAKRYTWSYDERDSAGLADVFTTDAVFDGMIADTEQVGPYVGRTAVVEWLQGHMDRQTDQRRHTCMNHVVVSQDDNFARVIATLVLTSASAGHVRLVTTGFYRIDLVKTVAGWQISHIFGGFDCPF